MIRFLKSMNSSFIIKFLLVLIGVSFIGWEFGGGIQQQFSPYIVKVDGQKIMVSSFQRELDLKISQLRRQMGKDYSEEVIASMNLPENLLQDKIRDLLHTRFAEDHKIQISDAEIIERISKMDAFKDGMGEFSASQYKIALNNAGYSVPQFEQSMRVELMVNLVRTPFIGASFTNTDEINRTGSILSESRDVKILRIVKADVEKPKAPTDADLRDIYEDMLSSLITPEKRDIEVLTFSADKLKETIAITNDEIKAYYGEHRSEFGEPEGREVRHILAADEKGAEEALLALAAGKTFAEVAKELSTDKLTADNGGKLGLIYRGDMLHAFDEAAFSLPVKEVSAPIKTPFGVHVIEVTKIVSGREKTFQEAKAEIKDHIKIEKTLNILYDMVDKADDMLAGSALLEDVAAEVGGTLTTYTNIDGQGFDANNKPITIIGGDVVLDKAFVMDIDVPSTVIHINDTTKTFVNVANITEPKQMSFEEVKNQLVDVYTKEMIQRDILAKATQILALRKNGDSFETLAKKFKLSEPIQTVVGVTRVEPAKSPLINGAIQTELSTLAQNEVLDRTFPTKMGAALYEVATVDFNKPNDVVLAGVQQFLSSTFVNDLYAQYLQAMQVNTNVEINDAQLAAIRERIFPQQ